MNIIEAYSRLSLLQGEMCKTAIDKDQRYYMVWSIAVNAYKERKRLKLKLEKDLLPKAWHPSRAVDWCFNEDEKRMIP